MMEGIYRHQIAGYYIWETEVEINYQGGTPSCGSGIMDGSYIQ